MPAQEQETVQGDAVVMCSRKSEGRLAKLGLTEIWQVVLSEPQQASRVCQCSKPKETPVECECDIPNVGIYRPSTIARSVVASVDFPSSTTNSKSYVKPENPKGIQ